MNLLEVRNLNMQYTSPLGLVNAVDDISFDLSKGQAIGIVGESGSGKTSMSLALMRLQPKNATGYSGSIKLDGLETMTLSNDDFRRQVRWNKMSMVFQGAINSLNPVIRVGDQIAEPLSTISKMNNKAKRDRAINLLELVGLPPNISQRYPHELSGGMKQRVMIAMALVLEPQLVILDEPTSALDVSVQAQIMNLLKDLKRDLGISFIFITHDIALASDLCDLIAVMYAGEIAELSSSEDIFHSPQHPYSIQLLNSIPTLNPLDTPQFIPGAPPNLINPPVGCRFQERCEQAFEKCTNERPRNFLISPGHHVNCWQMEISK